MLYRKNLLKLIKKKIPYIDQLDTTLLGSRPGINVLATWMTLLRLNKQKISRSINQALQTKEEFLKKIAQDNLNIQIINNKDSLQACIISKNKQVEKHLTKKYGLKKINYNLLINNNRKSFAIYKLYFK